MILRKDGDSLICVDIGSRDTEDYFIEMNPDFIKAQGLPYSVSGYYKYDIDGETIILDEEQELHVLKNIKMLEIIETFDSLMAGGQFETSLGFITDNRRGEGKDDKDNVQSLIELGQEPVYFKDANNGFHVLTIADMVILKQEMILDGLGKYQWKWTKENEIMNASSIEELEAI